MRQSSQRAGHFSQRGRGRSNRSSTRKRAPLNCIVDEGALIAGLVDATDPADNLKTWVRDGAINVFIPLYTLEMLNMLRSSPPPTNLNARQTLEWLDYITSITENKSAGHVELQGPEDQYQSWAEVERYLLPETPLSSNNMNANVEVITKNVNEKFSLRDDEAHRTESTNDHQPLSSSTSLDKSTSPLASPKMKSADEPMTLESNHTRYLSRSSEFSYYSSEPDSPELMPAQSALGTASIPPRMRPLLNYVVWRTHHQGTLTGASQTYILLTNDPNTRKQAQQFGVRAKLVTQLRFIIARDRKRSLGQAQPNANGSTVPPATEDKAAITEERTTELSKDTEDVEDEVVFSPRRPHSRQTDSSTPNVWDPDHFGRQPVEPTPPQTIQEPKQGGRGQPSPRKPSGSRGQPRTQRGKEARDGRGSTRGRSGPKHERQQIDPDSFDRPAPANRRGRGNFRKLWYPDG